ncbi:MAG: zinc-dependent alcohol dehydrogenase family protein [Actinomycetota bacterium]
MRAWRCDEVAGDLRLSRMKRPVPAANEILVRVLACGVCRTDLHVVDRDLPVHRDRIVPGHQVVGDVVQLGSDVTSFTIGDRVGIAWLRETCGQCAWCRSGRENLCPDSRFTGWDADGGYAQYATVRADYAYGLPHDVSPEAIAPLLCSGIIGARALARASLPVGGKLGIYGYGASAHLTAQVATAQGARIFVMTRGEENQALARSLGVEFVGGEQASPPEPLDSAIVFAPAGELVPVALRATARGGTVTLAGIHMSEIPAMDYDTTLFGERDLRSVTANTREDGRTFLALAHSLDLTTKVTTYPFAAVGRALNDLRAGRASGSLCITFADA